MKLFSYKWRKQAPSIIRPLPPSALESAPQRRITMSEQNPEIKATTEAKEVDLTKDEQPEKPPTPLERILQSLRKAKPASNPPASGGRRDLGKDKSKTLYVLVAAGIAVILFLLMYLSLPQRSEAHTSELQSPCN